MIIGIEGVKSSSESKYLLPFGILKDLNNDDFDKNFHAYRWFIDLSWLTVEFSVKKMHHIISDCKAKIVLTHK